MSDTKNPHVRNNPALAKKTRRSNIALKRLREEMAPIHQVIEDAKKAGEGLRPNVVQKNIEKFLDPKIGAKKEPWETEGGGFGPSGEFLTLDDLIRLKPFTFEDLNATVAFRANEKMMRAFQRVKEASGEVYDIMSDLYRECAMIGLLVMSERHKEILGVRIVISKAEAHQRLKDDCVAEVLQLKDSLRPLNEPTRKVYFQSFMEAVSKEPRWAQEAYMEEVTGDGLLGPLYDAYQEAEDAPDAEEPEIEHQDPGLS